MPPGSKKRKAAKKKKEKETHSGKSSPNNNPQGINDVNSQDEKGSNGGEVSSSSHQEHGNPQDQLNKRNEELEVRGAPSVRPIVSEDKSPKGDVDSVQKVRVENDGVVRTERELKEDSATKNVVIEHGESAKGSSNSTDRSSSSSSSDDESRVVERRRKEDAYASGSEEPRTDLVKPVDSLPPAGKTTNSATERVPVVQHGVSVHLTGSTPVESSVISNDVVKSGLQNGAQKLLAAGAPVTLTDPVSKKIEDRASPLLAETAKASVNVAKSMSKESESKVLPSLGTPPAQDSNDDESIKNYEVPETSEKQPLVAPAPPVAQKTSWFSCCGILDVFTGSSR